MRPRRMRLGYVRAGGLADAQREASMRPRRMRLGYRAPSAARACGEQASMRPRRMRLGYRFPYNILFPKAISRCFRAVAFHGG